MTREELFSAILVTCPRSGDLVYIERCGEDYLWNRIAPNADVTAGSGSSLPDAWIYYTGRWPSKDEDINSWRGFFDDLLAEMESMVGGADRCRWPLDEPWPHGR